MYQFQKAAFNGGQSCKYIIYEQGEQLSYINFITLLQQEKQFRSFFISLLSDVSFYAYEWETPPVSTGTKGELFEFVIHNSPGIDLPPDPDPFRQYFRSSSLENGIAVFDNLGKDARLIAPAPPEEGVNFSHIGVFTSRAPIDLQHQLWQKIGRVTKELISEEPLWLNTAGGGVAWLHVRLDTRPKYYRHQSYIT
jgi:hypothetical protein